MGLMGSPSTAYFLYFHYFGHVVAHSCFSTSYTVHGLLFLSFRAPLSPFTSLRPICLSHGPMIHYSYRLGLMGFLSICQTLFCPCCWASSSHLGFQNGPQHSQIQNQRFTNTKYLMRIAHKPKRESQSNSKSCNVPRESEPPNCRTKQQQTSLTIPNCNPQISNNQTKREPLFLTPSHLILSNFL